MAEPVTFMEIEVELGRADKVRFAIDQRFKADVRRVLTSSSDSVLMMTETFVNRLAKFEGFVLPFVEAIPGVLRTRTRFGTLLFRSPTDPSTDRFYAFLTPLDAAVARVGSDVDWAAALPELRMLASLVNGDMVAVVGIESKDWGRISDDWGRIKQTFLGLGLQVSDLYVGILKPPPAE